MKEKKSETAIVKGTLTKELAKSLDSLIGPWGSNRQDVVAKILTTWLYNEGYVKELRDKKSPTKTKK